MTSDLGAAPPVSLPVHVQLRTTDPEAAHELLSRMYVEHVPRLSGDRERFRFRSRSTRTDVLGLDRGRHSMTVDTEAEPHRALYVVQVLGGRLRIADRSGEVVATAGDTVLLPPHTGYRVHWAALRWQVARLDGDALLRSAADLLAAEGPVRFALCRPLSADHLRYWRSVLRHVGRDVLEVAGIAASPLARSEAFRMLAQATLQTFPNTGLDAATDPHRGGPGTAEPAVVRRAVEYIDAHAAEPIVLAQIAAAARVGARGLQQGFRRYRDTTPLAYLRSVRMERAHADLLAADPAAGDTVGAIASRWGFTHHGQFAVDYRRRYHCPPSRSLRAPALS